MLRMKCPLHLGGLVFLPLLLTACNQGGSLTIDGSTDLIPGDAAQLSARYTANRRGRDVTQTAEWSSSNPAVLSVTLGLVTAHAAGEVTLHAFFEQVRASRRVLVRALSGVEGAYTLTLGGGACPGTMPAALRQRTYAATARFRPGNRLEVRLSDGDVFDGRISGQNATFELLDYGYYSTPSVVEVLPDGNLLVISGTARTTSSPAGFVGTLDNGFVTLYPPSGPLSVWPLDTSNALAVCASSSHVFSMTR